jgi:hypothetical protein
MQANTFDVIERRKRITFFKLGKLWVFKQFFDNHELFNALLDYYNKDLYRFEFKSTGARNNAKPYQKEIRYPDYSKWYPNVDSQRLPVCTQET